MIFVLAITLLFVALAVYFYFQAEKYQKQLIKNKAESHAIRKENRALLESLMLVANRQESFVKHRLAQLLEQYKEDEEMAQQLQLITPLINNYAVIFSACLKGKGQLSKITKQCYNSINAQAFDNFKNFVTKDVKMKRLWGSNTLSGYMALIEALLLKFENLSVHTDIENKKCAEKLSKAG